MKKINIKQVKQIEIELLVYLNKICLENNIKLFLGGGTLLGAVRHNGFIPWDDDIDVMLLRSDYNKLIDILKNNDHEYFKLLNYDNVDGYYYPFAKIVDTRTVVFENKLRTIPDMGVYVDIFPIDNLPDNSLLQKYIFFKRKICQVLTNILSTKNYVVGSKGVKHIFKLLFYNLFKNVKANQVASNFDKLLIKYNDVNTRNVVCITGSYVKKEVMPKEYISDSVFVEFEGCKYLAPIGYNDYLTKHYGKNYMQLPPKEKRISNHDNVAYWK